MKRRGHKTFLKVLKFVVAFLIIAACVTPAEAVFEERDLPHTLSVLRYELRNIYKSVTLRRQRIEIGRARQRKQMVELMENCNELALMLYSQKQDFTFDLTYALEEVTKQYNSFNKNRRPFMESVEQIDLEIERYNKLIRTLQILPPSLVSNPNDTTMVADSTVTLAQLSNVNAAAKMVHKLAAKSGDTAETASSGEEASKNSKVGGFIKAIAGGGVMNINSEALPDSIAPAALKEVKDSSGTLRMVLTGNSLIDRDSCLYYSQNLLKNYKEMRREIVQDSVNYDATKNNLEEAYNYAQRRYRAVQKKIFVEGQTNYLDVLRTLPIQWKRVKADITDKYVLAGAAKSEWNGPMVLGFMFFVLFYLIIASVATNFVVKILTKRIKFLRSESFKSHKICFNILTGIVFFAITITIACLSLNQHFFTMATKLIVEFAWLSAAIVLSFAIRLRGDQVKAGLKAYTPVLTACFTIIFIRITFVPNSLLNMFLPLVLILFSFWQWKVIRKQKKHLPTSDYFYNITTLGVLLISTVVCLSGYVLLSILIVIWWIFQLTLIQTITALTCLLKTYYEKSVSKKKKSYLSSNKALVNSKDKNSYIEVTWFYDFLQMTVIPVIIVWSIPLCLYMASKVFDLSTIYSSYLSYPFLNFEGYIHLSLMKVAVAVSLLFVFRYISYAAKAWYRIYKIRVTMSKLNVKEIPANQLNLTLANSVIAICAWGVYIFAVFAMLHIPSTAVSIVGAGLATGIGFALKDVINNFFYGVSMMNGRLRVGDYVECDGIRGKVENITYQSTQIETGEGSVMAIPNSALYAKNFKNLTRNHAYELVVIPVGVKYGSDIAAVREMLVEEVKKLQRIDKYGRELMDSSYGVVVRLAGFGDNSVDLKVYQNVLVEERFKYEAAAKEVIYNTLNRNNVEIPFPQRDVYIKEFAAPRSGEKEQS